MKQRLLSIDVFRGMTIFFMIIVNTPGSWKYVYAPLRHAPWDGLTPTDLVFPFFIFIMGLSMSFSFKKYEVSDRKSWIQKIVKRTVLIIAIGILLNWFPFFNKSLSEVRVFGVLQRIGLAYGFAALVVVFTREKLLPFVLGLLLAFYWIILLAFGGEEPLTLQDNAVRVLDLFLVGPQHIYHGYGMPFDPEGLLSTIPSIATALFGYLVGKRIQMVADPLQKVFTILPVGIAGILIGVLWHFMGFPINKPLWSSSYVLVAGGLATLCLALLIFIIDHKGLRRWSLIFEAFGLNALVSYVLSGIILKTFLLIKVGNQQIYAWIYDHIYQHGGLYLGSFLQAISYTLVIWLFAYVLYKRKIVIKI